MEVFSFCNRLCTGFHTSHVTCSRRKKFGRKPAYWKEPPSLPYEQTVSSLEMISNYYGSTTQFLMLDCDTSQHRVFVNYVNFDSTVYFQRTLLAGKHYLQVYNGDYDCLFDGEIPGKLAFVRNGRIYVLTHEQPEFLRFVVFVLNDSTNASLQRTGSVQQSVLKRALGVKASASSNGAPG